MSDFLNHFKENHKHSSKITTQGKHTIVTLFYPCQNRTTRLNHLKSLCPNLDNIKFIDTGSGEIRYENFIVRCKPEKNTSLNSGLTASSFLVGFPKEKITLDGKLIECYSVRNKHDFESGIIQNIEQEHIKNAVGSFFKNGVFDFKECTKTEINSLAIYLGELLVPYSMLESLDDAFFIPVDSNFSGIDSIVLKSGDYIKISNKAGVGAAASLFSNILPYAQASNTTLGKLYRCALNRKIKNIARSGTEIIYEYAKQYIMEFSTDSMLVYNEYKEGRTIEEIDDWFEQNKSMADDVVVKNYPNSLSSFICRTIAKELQNDSIDEIKKIIGDKKFFQANINMKEFNDGKLVFDLNDTGKMDVVVHGNKAATTSIQMKQGLINYTLLAAN